MDNDKNLKRKSISLIAKNLILLLSVAVTGVIGALSWFSNNTTATAEGISVSCEAPDGIEIAIVEHGAAAPVSAEYSTILTLDKDCAVLKNLKMTEVTGEGLILQKPQLKQSDGEAAPVKGEWDSAYEGRDYICFDLYIRSKAALDIYLAAESSVDANSSILTGPNSTRKSKYGEFSMDCVVGATRVAIFDAKVKQRELLWIPRPDIQLTGKNGNFTVNTNVSSEETRKHTYWDIDQNKTEDTKAVSSVINGSRVELGTDQKIVTLSDKNTTDNFYYNHVVYKLWIEGEDSEARLALANGEFTMNIRLVGKKQPISD